MDISGVIFRVFLLLCSIELSAAHINYKPHEFFDEGIAYWHKVATGKFKNYKDSGFKEIFHDDFVNAYTNAIKNAKGLDRAVVLRRFATSLWAIKPWLNIDEEDMNDDAKKQAIEEKNSQFIQQNLRHAQALMIEVDDILSSLNANNPDICLQHIQALLDDIKINFTLKNGERVLKSCLRLLDLNPNDDAKLICYQDLASLYFARNDFEQSEKYIAMALSLNKNQTTEIRLKAKLIMAQAKLENIDQFKKDLQIATQMLTTALSKDTVFGQILEDVFLLFTVSMMNPDPHDLYFDAYSSIMRTINNIVVKPHVKKSIKKKIKERLPEIIETHQRRLAHELFKDISAPFVRLNEKRIGEIKAKIADLELHSATHPRQF